MNLYHEVLILIAKMRTTLENRDNVSLLWLKIIWKLKTLIAGNLVIFKIDKILVI